MDNKNPFEFDRSFISDYINDMKEMMQEFKDEFGLDMNNRFKYSKKYNVNYIPIEIWETSNQLELYLFVFNCIHKNQIEIKIKDNRNIYIKIPYPSIIKNGNDHSTLVYTDIPQYVERDIFLPQPIKSHSIEKTLDNGFLVITLNKETPDFDLPIEI